MAKRTKEHNEKIGLANKGKRKGKKYEDFFDEETCIRKKKQQSEMMLNNHPFKGKHFSDEHKENLRKSRTDPNSNYQKWMHSDKYSETRSRIAVKNQTDVTYEEWLEMLPEMRKYYRKVAQYTRRQPIKTLPNYDKRGPSGKEGAYQLDHIISRSYGFHNNIPPEEIGHISNLRFIPWLENALKGSNLIQ